MRTLRGLLWAELGVPGANVGGGDLLDFGLAEVWKNQPLKLALVEFASPGRQSPALNIVGRVIAEASQCLPAEAGGRGRLPVTAADGPLHGRKPGLRIDSGAERVRGAVKLPIWPEVASSESFGREASDTSKAASRASHRAGLGHSRPSCGPRRVLYVS